MLKQDQDESFLIKYYYNIVIIIKHARHLDKWLNGDIKIDFLNIEYDKNV